MPNFMSFQNLVSELIYLENSAQKKYLLKGRILSDFWPDFVEFCQILTENCRQFDLFVEKLLLCSIDRFSVLSYLIIWLKK